MTKKKKRAIERKHSVVYAIIVARKVKGLMILIKKLKKNELCSLTSDNKKENKGEKRSFHLQRISKKPTEAGMLSTIDENTFHLFTKKTWIGDSGALCHVTNNDTGH